MVILALILLRLQGLLGWIFPDGFMNRKMIDEFSGAYSSSLINETPSCNLLYKPTGCTLDVLGVLLRNDKVKLDEEFLRTVIRVSIRKWELSAVHLLAAVMSGSHEKLGILIEESKGLFSRDILTMTDYQGFDYDQILSWIENKSNFTLGPELLRTSIEMACPKMIYALNRHGITADRLNYCVAQGEYEMFRRLEAGGPEMLLALWQCGYTGKHVSASFILFLIHSARNLNYLVKTLQEGVPRSVCIEASTTAVFESSASGKPRELAQLFLCLHGAPPADLSAVRLGLEAYSIYLLLRPSDGFSLALLPLELIQQIILVLLKLQEIDAL